MRAAKTIGDRRSGPARPAPSIPSRGIGRRRAGLAAGASLLLLALGACVSTPITVDASDAAPIARSATIHVALAAPADPAAPAEAAAAQAGGGVDPGLGAELEGVLKARAERALEARGYAIGTAIESDLVLELVPRAERSTRRTWSSDPDASALRSIEQNEAVLALRARDLRAGHEVWSGEARTKLADSARAPGRRATELWSRLLDRALERVPRKPD